MYKVIVADTIDYMSTLSENIIEIVTNDKVTIQTNDVDLARALITNEEIQDVLDETQATLAFEVTDEESE